MKLRILFVVLFLSCCSLLAGVSADYITKNGIETEVVLVNPSENPITILLGFYSYSRRPIEANIDDYGYDYRHFIDLEPFEVWSFSLNDEDISINQGIIGVDFITREGLVILNTKLDNTIIATKVLQLYTLN